MTAQTKNDHAEEIKCIVNRIMHGEKFNANFDGNFGNKISRQLHENGFKVYETGSYCKKASFETHLKHNGSHVGIIDSNFFGAFTQVTVN